ncbi:T9SS type A sorting domain-containing protein [Flavobacterium sp. CBA20B-1]|uniref:T9SS type A sorting domain-containing protein n=1 Tax=unclassified Flavobacterium TaxID=196869 RepID=UPI002224F03F|nr:MULTISPECIES: T9SS type A sorting domain-containing protein [unclassified Flavobacterium]WCM41546.1 T9SS type A sorting domain-containing protein [Flavobacterium sp. CBA20B-1]
MKKIIFLLVFALSLFELNAQISYTQGWETTGLNSWTSSGSGSFSRVTTTPCIGTASARANNYYGGTSYLVSPALTGTNGGDLTVSFSYKVTQYSSNTTGQTLTDLGTIKLQWATSTSGPWTDVFQVDNTNHTVSASCAVKTATFSGLPVSGNVYIRFNVTSGTSSADNYVYIDDVVVSQGAAPSCLTPSGVTTNNITQTGATVYWVASPSNPSANYDIYWSTNNTAPTSTTAASYTNQTSPYNATGLAPNTTYFWWVRSNCGGSGYSSWVSGGSFKTLCNPYTIPYFEGFESSYTDAATIGGCLFQESINGTQVWTANSSATDYNRSPRTGNWNAFLRYSNDDWIYIPINLTGGVSYTVELYARQDGSTSTNSNITVSYGTSAVATAMTNTIVPATGIINGNYQLITGSFTPATTGTYYVGIKGFMNSSPWYISLDDISIDATPTCISPTALVSSNPTATGVTMTWTASTSNPSGNYDIYWSTSNTAPTNTTTPLATNQTSPYNATGLSSDTTYFWWVRANCGAGDTSKWASGGSFKTLCNPYTTPYFEGFETGYTDAATIGGCLFQESINGTQVWTANSSATDYNRSPRTGNWNAFLRYSNDDWIYIPINLIGGTGYTVELYARQDGSTATNSDIAISYGTSASDTAMTNAIVPPTGIIDGNYQLITGKFTPATTGTYYVGIKGFMNGSPWYISLDDIRIDVTPPPTATTTVVNNTCYGGTTGTAEVITVDGTPPYTYSWAPSGGTGFKATGLAAGTYTVTVTDANNVTATATAVVTEPDALVSNAVVNNISCNGSNNGTIDITPTGGTAPYTYLWTTGDTGTSVSNLAPGTYSLTITDANNCTATEDFVITEPTVLVATNAAQTNVTLFGGNDGSATVAASGGTAPYTYMWSNGATTAAITNLTAGTYTATVTDANGCTATEDFVITQPIPLMAQSVSQTNVSCNGGSDASASIVAIGGNAPYTYQWSPSGGTAATATGLSAGMYSVLVTDHTGNTITENFTITEPAPIVGTVSKTDITCNGANNGTATVSVAGGTAPYTYLWSNGMMSNMATNLNVGNYTVSITDANGCKATASVSIAQPTALVITGTATNISCFGQNDGAITVSATGGTAPYSYSWSNGQSGTSLSSLAKGTYIVTVTDANGCSKTESYTIVEPAFVTAPVAFNQSFCIGQNATLADVVITGSTIKWYSALTGGMLLPATTVLTNGTTYYASQTVGTCESSTRTAVQITLNQGTPLTTTQLNVCSNTRVQNMTIDGFNYTQLKWYSSPTSAIQLPASQLLATGTYYISSLTGTCESPRQAVQVTVAAAVPAPTATAQTVCGNSTLNDLVVGKDPSASLNWYSSLQSMIPLSGTTQVSNGTYYVQQVIGNCESVRVAVPVQVVNVTAPTMTSITACNGTQIGDLNTPTTTYVWYVSNTATTPLPNSFVLTSGSYYIAQENAGCISTRTNVAVNVSPVPNSPTGQTTQTFPYPAKVSDLVMNQPNVKWYASANDAIEMINELAPSTFLMSNTTYYGIIVNPNNCGSAPTAVTVILSVSTQELDLTQLKYYPNPVDSALHISYNEAITKVEVFTLTGQKVMSNEFNAIEVTTDLSRLSSGTYLVKVETAKASQFIKVVKR